MASLSGYKNENGKDLEKLKQEMVSNFDLARKDSESKY
jgi:hypothetical protein